LEAAVSFFVGVEHARADVGLSAERSVEVDHGADARAFAGADHGPPIVNFVLGKEEQLKLAAAARIDATDTGVEDAGII
jgi:hypothetical protein